MRQFARELTNSIHWNDVLIEQALYHSRFTVTKRPHIARFQERDHRDRSVLRSTLKA
jgi:hypothetical protein